MGVSIYQEVVVIGIYMCGYRVCCKEVYRFPHTVLLIPTPLVLALFCSSIPTSLFVFKIFFRSCLCYFCAM